MKVCNRSWWWVGDILVSYVFGFKDFIVLGEKKHVNRIGLPVFDSLYID